MHSMYSLLAITRKSPMAGCCPPRSQLAVSLGPGDSSSIGNGGPSLAATRNALNGPCNWQRSLRTRNIQRPRRGTAASAIARRCKKEAANMSSGPLIPDPPDRPHWLSIALVVSALVAILAGLFDPRPNTERRASEPEDRLAVDRGDEDAGFPKKAEPDNPPRGPGP
jgi:hypothetical protein